MRTVLDGHQTHNLSGVFKGKISVMRGQVVKLKLATTSSSHIPQVIRGLEDIITFLKEEESKVKPQIDF